MSATNINLALFSSNITLYIVNNAVHISKTALHISKIALHISKTALHISKTALHISKTGHARSACLWRNSCKILRWLLVIKNNFKKLQGLKKIIRKHEGLHCELFCIIQIINKKPDGPETLVFWLDVSINIGLGPSSGLPASLGLGPGSDLSANLGLLLKKFTGSEDFLFALLVPHVKHLVEPGLFSYEHISQLQVEGETWEKKASLTSFYQNWS